MTGGILQLVALGLEDVYLTGQPQITNFKIVYKRHSNFSIYDQELKIRANTDFGSEFIVKIPHNGDLLRRMFLTIKLPTINLTNIPPTNKLIHDMLLEIGITWTYAGGDDDLVTLTVYNTSIKPLLDAQNAHLTLDISFYTEMLARIQALTPPAVQSLQYNTLTIFYSLLEPVNISGFYPTPYDENLAHIQKTLYDGLMSLYIDMITVYLGFLDNETSSLEFVINGTFFIAAIINSSFSIVTEWRYYQPPLGTNPTVQLSTLEFEFYMTTLYASQYIPFNLIGTSTKTFFDSVLNSTYIYLMFIYVGGVPYDYTKLDSYDIYIKYMNDNSDNDTITSSEQFQLTRNNLLQILQYNMYVIFKSYENIMTLFQNSKFTTINTNRFRLGFFKKFANDNSNYYYESNIFSSITKQSGPLNDKIYDVLSTISSAPIYVTVRKDYTGASDIVLIADPYPKYSYRFSENEDHLNDFVTDTITAYGNSSYIDYINYFQIWLRVNVNQTVMKGRLSNTTINNGNNYYALFPTSFTKNVIMNYIPYLTVRDIPFLVNELLSKITKITNGAHIYTNADITVAIKQALNLIDNDERTDGTFLTADDALLKYHLYQYTSQRVICNDTELAINDLDYLTQLNNNYGSNYILMSLFRPEGVSPQYTQVVGGVLVQVGTYKYSCIPWICSSFKQRYNDIIDTFVVDPELIASLKVIVNEMVDTFQGTIIPFATYNSRNRIFNYTNHSSSGIAFEFDSSLASGLYSDAIATVYNNRLSDTITRFNTTINYILGTDITYRTTTNIITDYNLIFAGLTTDGNYISMTRGDAGYETACTNMITKVVGSIVNNTYVVPYTHLNSTESYLIVYSQGYSNLKFGYDLFINDTLAFGYKDDTVPPTPPNLIYAPYFFYVHMTTTNFVPSPELEYVLTLLFINSVHYKYITSTGSTNQYLQYLMYDTLNPLLTSYLGSYWDIETRYQSLSPMPYLTQMDIYNSTDIKYISDFLNVVVAPIFPTLESIYYQFFKANTNVLLPLRPNPYTGSLFTNLETWFNKYKDVIYDIGGEPVIHLAFEYLTTALQPYITSQSMYTNPYGEYLCNNFDGYSNIIMYIIVLIITSNTHLSFLLKYVYKDFAETKETLINLLESTISTSQTLLLNTIATKNKIVTLISSATPSFQYVPELGHRIIELVDIKIGEKLIDSHTDELLHLLHLIQDTKEQERGYNKLIGNTTEMTTLSSSQRSITKLYIPMRFWFCKDDGNSLPLISLLYTDVTVRFKLRALEQVLQISPTSFNYQLVTKPKLKCGLLCQFIYLDDDERKIFITTRQNYLIEQYVYNIPFIINSNLFMDSQEFDMKLNLMHSIKYLIWNVKFTSNPNTYQSYMTWNDYTYSTFNEFFTSIKLKFYGRVRENEKDEIYYNSVQPYEKYVGSLDYGNYFYGFGLMPNFLQPSGSANFSILDDCHIIMSLNDDMYNIIQAGVVYGTIKLWGCGYNILMIMSGMGGTIFN